MPRKIVAGNWKMHNDLSETVMVAPSFTNLYKAFESTREHPIQVIAQNMHQSEKGAFTGEISASMLKSVGVKTVIIGHSERRAYFNETDDLLAEKVNAALESEIQVIFCIGEELNDRENGDQYEVIQNQLENGLFQDSWEHIMIAYEPVWAIGTGETASPKQAQEMHQFIREAISKQYGKGVSKEVSILYGGSVKPANAKEIFAKKDVDGGLIGGASLKADAFIAIINAFE